MFARSLGCPPCHVNFGGGGCVPCEPNTAVPECEGCFDEKTESFFQKNDIWPAVISGVIIAVATAITLSTLRKQGVEVE